MQGTKFVDDLFLVALVLAAVYLSRMVHGYIRGKKVAGDVLLEIKRKPFNIYMVFAVGIVLLGCNDLRSGNYLLGAMMILFGVWSGFLGYHPINFHKNGLMFDLEYYEWSELTGWGWDEKGREMLLIQFDKKRPCYVPTMGKKEDVDRFLTGIPLKKAPEPEPTEVETTDTAKEETKE